MKELCIFALSGKHGYILGGNDDKYNSLLDLK